MGDDRLRAFPAVAETRAEDTDGSHAELTRRAYAASVPEFELMRSAAAVAPEVAAVGHQVEARRRANQVRLVTYLREKGVLRKDLAPGEAADIVWALTSYDLYRALVAERHWPAERCQDWLAGTLADGLLAP